MRSGLAVLILLLFIIFSYRNGRNLLLLASSIVVNLLIALFSIKLLGVSIHLYTLAGLTISFGLLIDNAIIMFRPSEPEK
jgi:multidrug efflux pump subunit AcrB